MIVLSRLCIRSCRCVDNTLFVGLFLQLTLELFYFFVDIFLFFHRLFRLFDSFPFRRSLRDYREHVGNVFFNGGNVSGEEQFLFIGIEKARRKVYFPLRVALLGNSRFYAPPHARPQGISSRRVRRFPFPAAYTPSTKRRIHRVFRT